MHRYCAFCDPSGGVADSFSLAIAHVEGEPGAETIVIDLARERHPPFSPESVVAEFAEVCKAYRISQIYGDNYSAEWVKERFRVEGVNYVPSTKNRSELYLNMLPLIMSRTVSLLDNRRLLMQFSTLQRSTGPGRDRIDHPRNQHDDLANSVAGAAFHARALPKTNRFSFALGEIPGSQIPLPTSDERTVMTGSNRLRTHSGAAH
jgi:hypothetical protein